MATKPRIIQARNGWLAVSPAGFIPRIGVMADSEEAAELAFDQELLAWEELHKRPDPTPMRRVGTR